MTNSLIRFQLFLRPICCRWYQLLWIYVGQNLGCPTELTVGASFDNSRAGETDIGLSAVCPIFSCRQTPSPVETAGCAVLQASATPAAHLLSDVIVRRDSPHQTFADLAGCCWSYNDLGSHSGYNITRLPAGADG